MDARSGGARRWLRRSLAFWSILVTVGFGGVGRAAVGSVEYAVKATYLCKFAPFVEWPLTAFASRSSPLYLCVLGVDPFGPVLDEAVRGRGVGDHPIIVRRLRRLDDGERCHILYTAGSPRESVAEALRKARGTPVLTVTDQAQGGGIIQFVVKDDRVRFDIDTAAASASGVRISSKLLSLALSARAKGWTESPTVPTVGIQSGEHAMARLHDGA